MYFKAGMVPPDTEVSAVTQLRSVRPSSRRMEFKKDKVPKSKVAAR